MHKALATASSLARDNIDLPAPTLLAVISIPFVQGSVAPFSFLFLGGKASFFRMCVSFVFIGDL